MRLPKTLHLYKSKWRCGNNSSTEGNYLGKGKTSLLNRQGYQCCLGQFCTQVGISENKLIRRDTPDDLSVLVETLNKSIIGYDGSKDLTSTRFSTVAMDINDNEETTVNQKIKKLRSLCKKYSRKLVVHE